LSQVLDNFLLAARGRNWRTAFLNCNGLNMYEMLRGISSLDVALQNEMRAQIPSFVGQVNTPRIEYAMNVVRDRRLPVTAPGDLAMTGQVQDAQDYLDEVAPSSPKTMARALVTAMDQGRLLGQAGIRQQLVAWADSGSFRDASGNIIKPSPELLRMLVTLVNTPGAIKLGVMSLARFNQGPHGEVQPDGTAICRAADITTFAGFPIDLLEPAHAPNTINGVARVVSALPAGKFTLGLPRPGGHSLLNPAQDVFLPVTDLSQVDKSPTGSFAGDIRRVKSQEARDALIHASSSNPDAKILFMFPDAVDHVHVKAM
jgi:hypothetical protein